jgi:DDE_Tnp_1-associated
VGQSASCAAVSAPAGPIVSVPVSDACCDLLELFAGVADGRVGQGRDHPVAAVLALAAAAVVAGMKGYTAITGWVADVPPAILADLYLRSGAAPRSSPRSKPRRTPGERGRQMRADNTAHLVAAASRRHELARSKAIRAVRELDAGGTTVTLGLSPGQPGCPDPGSTPSPISVTRSFGCAPSAAGHRERRCRPATAAATPPCCADWRPAPPATGNWPGTISGCATSSPKRSDNSAPPASAPIPGQRPKDQGKAALP